MTMGDGKKDRLLIQALPPQGEFHFWRLESRERMLTPTGVHASVWTFDLRVRWLMEVGLAEVGYVVYNRDTEGIEYLWLPTTRCSKSQAAFTLAGMDPVLRTGA